MSLVRTIVLVFSGILWGALPLAQGAALPLLPVPSNLERTEIYLLTVGLGPGIEARYGHTIIRVVDGDSGHDENLNWGVFSFDEPNFALNFFLGRLWYWAGSDSYSHILSHYQHYEERPLFSSKFNLSSTQKHTFILAINAFLRRQGGKYPYQYFYNNCATIPRDLLNQVLAGKLEEHFSKQAAGRTFRDYVYTNLNAPPIVAFILDITMNSRLDFEITRWQEMFSPLMLHQHLQHFPQVESPGEISAGMPLLGESHKLNSFSDYPASTWHLYPWWLAGSILLLWPALLERIFVPKRPQRGRRRWTAVVGQKGLGVYLLLWGLFAGLLGTVMTVSWLFSEHLDLHHNANLWFLWPTDFIFAWAGWRLLFTSKFTSKKATNANFTWQATICTAVLHVLTSAITIALFLTETIQQDISRVLIFLVPGMILAFVLVMPWCWQRYIESTGQ